MSALFERAARVAVDTLLISDLRIAFRVKKTLKKKPSSCEISISNLNEEHRAALQKKKTSQIILEAGYAGTVAQLFAGNSRYVDQVLNGATWETKIQCGDGERAYRYLRVNESFRPGTKVLDVITNVMQAMGMQAFGHMAELRQITEQFVSGYVAFGKVADQLDRLLHSRGFSWSIQDGQIQVLKVDGAIGENIIRLAADTGLIGSPEHGEPEKQGPLPQVDGEAGDVGSSVPLRAGPAVLKVKSLLQPGFKPGRKVKVESRGVNGVFRIQTVSHVGDTFGGDWYSELECLPA